MIHRPPLWEKQKDAISFAKRRKDRGVCFFMEMGTGKSRVNIEYMQWLIRQHDAKMIYIAAPLSVLHVWVKEWHLWADLPIIFIDLHETGPAGVREARKLADGGTPVICLINYEMAWRFGYVEEKVEIDGRWHKVRKPTDTTLHSDKLPPGPRGGERWGDIQWDIGVLDESTTIKTPSSRVSRFFRSKMKPITRYRNVLTGSAYIKKPLDVWAQMHYAVCEEDLAPLARTATEMAAKYSIPHPYIQGAIYGYKNLEDLVEKMSRVAILLKKTDVLDLQEPVHGERHVYLDAKTRKVYDDIESDMIASLEEFESNGGIVTVGHIFAVHKKLAQIASGFILPDKIPDPEKEGKFIQPPAVRLGQPKIDELLNILENRDRPTIVVTQWNEEELMVCEAIEKKFKFTPKFLSGRVTRDPAERDRIIASAKDDLAFVVKEKVAARGIDLRWSDMLIFMSHTNNTEFYDQMLSRNHRGGQLMQIYYMHLMARNTVDSIILKNLNKDLDMAAEIDRNWKELLRREAA